MFQGVRRCTIEDLHRGYWDCAATNDYHFVIDSQMTVDVQQLWNQCYAELQATEQSNSVQQTRKAWKTAQDYLSPKDLTHAFVKPSNEVLQALELLRHVH